MRDTILGASTLLFLLYFFWIEVQCMRSQGLKKYFTKLSDLMNLTSLIVTLFIILTNFFGLLQDSMGTLRVLAALVVLTQVGNFFYWLRLFDSVYFYFYLI